MSSSPRRWVNVSGMCINGVAFHDAIGASISMEAGVIGSNSETDTFANHFLMSNNASANVTFRTFDVYAASQLTSSIGDVVNASYILNIGAGMLTSDTRAISYRITANTICPAGGGLVISGVTIPGEHDTESICEITGVFRSNGADAPWKMVTVS